MSARRHDHPQSGPKQVVVVTTFHGLRGKITQHAYGPYPTRAKGLTVKRQIERDTVCPEGTYLEVRVSQVIGIDIEPTGARLIAQERERQIVEEGYTPEGDAQQFVQLVEGAVAYATSAKYPEMEWAYEDIVHAGYPWAREHWKPGTSLRDLQKAGALIAAAIDVRIAAGEKP